MAAPPIVSPMSVDAAPPATPSARATASPTAGGGGGEGGGGGGASAVVTPDTASSLTDGVLTMRQPASVLHAVTKLQARVRSKRSRAEYGKLLLKKYQAEEEENLQRQASFVAETLDMLDKADEDRRRLDQSLLHDAHVYRAKFMDTPVAAPPAPADGDAR